MGKYELRLKINNARNRIEDLNYEIKKLHDRKDRFRSDLSKMSDRKTILVDFYDNKLSKAVALQGVRGRANSTLRDKHVDVFSVGNKTSVENNYAGIVGYIQKNINTADEKIEECRAEINRLEGDISYWEQEIRNIEREEEEENARKQQLDNLR
ncbi:MAG: hypothetical protein E7257_03510 [Lachnospiraceae bacterium]|nr:hypothetical protein [Lachnospiraceae bacterium]